MPKQKHSLEKIDSARAYGRLGDRVLEKLRKLKEMRKAHASSVRGANEEYALAHMRKAERDLLNMELRFVQEARKKHPNIQGLKSYSEMLSRKLEQAYAESHGISVKHRKRAAEDIAEQSEITRKKEAEGLRSAKNAVRKLLKDKTLTTELVCLLRINLVEIDIKEADLQLQHLKGKNRRFEEVQLEDEIKGLKTKLVILKDNLEGIRKDNEPAKWKDSQPNLPEEKQ